MNPAACCHWLRFFLLVLVKNFSVSSTTASNTTDLLLLLLLLHGVFLFVCVYLCVSVCVLKCASVCVLPWYCIYIQTVYTTHTPHIDSVHPFNLTVSLVSGNSCVVRKWFFSVRVYFAAHTWTHTHTLKHTFIYGGRWKVELYSQTVFYSLCFSIIGVLARSH